MSQRTTISKKKFFFLQKQLNKAFQKLANNEYHCKQNKTNLPSHITKQDHRTEREVDKDSSILNLRNKPNQEAYPNTKSSSRKLPDKADTTDGGSKTAFSEPNPYLKYCQNICYETFYETFYSETCVTLTYLEHKYIHYSGIF